MVGSGIRKKPIPDPGSRIRGAKRFRIRIRNTAFPKISLFPCCQGFHAREAKLYIWSHIPVLHVSATVSSVEVQSKLVKDCPSFQCSFLTLCLWLQVLCHSDSWHPSPLLSYSTLGRSSWIVYQVVCAHVQNFSLLQFELHNLLLRFQRVSNASCIFFPSFSLISFRPLMLKTSSLNLLDSDSRSLMTVDSTVWGWSLARCRTSHCPMLTYFLLQRPSVSCPSTRF